jgi:inner membrane protein
LEPVTHVLASVALARAGLDRRSRLALPLLVVAGLAPDLDFLGLAGGPRGFVELRCAITHSVAGAAALAAAVAGVFCWFARKHSIAPLRFRPAFLLCAIGAAAHLLLDLGNSYGERLLWPFSGKWYSWDLVTWLDPWVLLLLAAGLLLPWLFRLISEEIGARTGRRASKGAIAALILVALYGGGRALMHARAEELLGSRTYHGAVPQVVGAFPEAASPLDWRGVVDTANTIETLEVSFAPGTYFDPDRSRSFYKPEGSTALQAARSSPTAQLLLRNARFPLAEIERTEDGYRVTLRDLRYGPDAGALSNPVATIELDSQFHVIHSELQFGAAAGSN